MMKQCTNRSNHDSTQLLDSRCFLAVHVELHKDDGVFEDGSKRSNEPRQILEEVLLLNRME